jgi:hypothetical protein
MDPYDAIAMWDEANVNISQQRVIKQYFRTCLGNKLFIPEGKALEEITKNIVLPKYGSYEYLSSKAQPEEKRPRR